MTRFKLMRFVGFQISLLEYLLFEKYPQIQKYGNILDVFDVL